MLSDDVLADQSRKVRELHERIKDDLGDAEASSLTAHNTRQAAAFDEAATFFASPEATPPEIKPTLTIIAQAVAASLGSNSRVLDVATGTGALLPFYEAEEIALCNVVGVDLSRDMLGYARERFPAASFVQADVLELTAEAAGGKFDAIVFNACFANLYDQRAALAHAASLLTERGRVFVSHPLGAGFIQQLHASDPRVVPHLLPDEAALGAMARPALRVASYRQPASAFYLASLERAVEDANVTY